MAVGCSIVFIPCSAEGEKQDDGFEDKRQERIELISRYARHLSSPSSTDTFVPVLDDPCFLFVPCQSDNLEGMDILKTNSSCKNMWEADTATIEEVCEIEAGLLGLKVEVVTGPEAGVVGAADRPTGGDFDWMQKLQESMEGDTRVTKGSAPAAAPVATSDTDTSAATATKSSTKAVSTEGGTTMRSSRAKKSDGSKKPAKEENVSSFFENLMK